MDLPSRSPAAPAATQRFERDVLSLSGVATLIWLEGINDFSKNGNASFETVQAAMKDLVGKIRASRPDMRLIGATVVSALGSTSAAHGFAEQDQKRQALNDFIRTSKLFDGVVEFDRATLDTKTGGLKPEFVPESTHRRPRATSCTPTAPVISPSAWRSTSTR